MRIESPLVLLADNGSLEPAAILGLRTVAERLGESLGQKVAPVSLRHSNAVPVDQLGGQPAELLTDALAARLAPLGQVERTAFLLRADIDTWQLTVFSDGRAIIGGTADLAVAKSVYARYIGT